MALIFWENTLITRDEKPVVALLLGTENGMYETNDSYCQAIEEAGGLPVQFCFPAAHSEPLIAGTASLRATTASTTGQRHIRK